MKPPLKRANVAEHPHSKYHQIEDLAPDDWRLNGVAGARANPDYLNWGEIVPPFFSTLKT